MEPRNFRSTLGLINRSLSLLVRPSLKTLSASEVSDMRNLHSVLPKFAPILFLLSFISPSAFAQATYSQPRIAAAVNDAQTTVLRGNTHPLARPQFDVGPAPANL